MNIKTVYYGVLGALSIAGGVLAQLLGGWDTALQTLCIFMAADYLTGIACALVWKKSPKSADGTFESKASIKGLFRKMGMLLAVLIACRLDLFMNTTVMRNTTILFFIANDGLSIVENLGIMGLPLPSIIKNAFAVLHSKAQSSEDK